MPEITTACWGILGKSPSAMMCASSRMVVKRKGAALPAVVACTLTPYDPQFELGSSLAEALGPCTEPPPLREILRLRRRELQRLMTRGIAPGSFEDLSVIIPTLHAAAMLGSCLDALAEAEGREIIVVDGGSEDLTASVACKGGAELIRAPRGRGVAAGGRHSGSRSLAPFPPRRHPA